MFIDPIDRWSQYINEILTFKKNTDYSQNMFDIELEGEALLQLQDQKAFNVAVMIILGPFYKIK